MSQVQYVHTACPRCGKRMTYEGGKKALKCRNCGYKRELGINTDQVQNHPLTAGIRWGDFSKGMGLDLKAFKCGSCNAITTVFEKEEPGSCVFCNSKKWEESDQLKKVLEPYGMMPFIISQQSAIDKLKKYLNPKARFPLPSIKWWYPRGIHNILEKENLRGVFVPVIYADIFNRTTWSGKANFKTYQKQGNKYQEKRVLEPVSGYWENFFTEQFQGDSKGLANQFQEILPYKIGNAIPFKSAHLQSWPVELYQSKEVDILKKIDKRINKRIEREAKSRSKGEGMKDLKIQSEKFLITLRHVIVPVWVATYTYRGKRFQFLVNGQSGKLTGKKPLSFTRIGWTILLASIGMILTAWLISL
ncbi:MAG: hypothetical protein MRZ79_23910 [Bacteroidia bacterium]|nr:hypothetical protein [Bacteroidia bacterium]